jgi:flavin-dependent dehydrogenase
MTIEVFRFAGDERMQELIDDAPVIIGAGLSGMAISDWLSKARIPHLMLGKPPNRVPRLGESMDPAGTIEMLRYYPEYSQYYFKKRWITVYLGEYATACNFDSGLTRTIGMRLMGFQSPASFIHVDRIGFDLAFWERVTVSGCCHTMDTLVSEIEYDKDSDRIVSMQLASGATVRPRYVFDCTNHVRLLGRKLDIPVDLLSEPQRVIFSHYHVPAGTPSEKYFGSDWNHSTNILRMYEDIDGMNGLAWAIPLGTYISVGASFALSEPEQPSEEVVEKIVDAYVARGMPIRDVFSERAQVVTIPRQQYFFHHRAFGANWLLAGPTYGQVWFPTSSGVGAALVAGFVAPSILNSPKEVGQVYQNYISGLRQSHMIFDRMFKRHHSELSHNLVKVESNRIVGENVKRVARLSIVHHKGYQAAFSKLLLRAVSRDGVAKSGCKVYQRPLPQQTETIFAYK